MPRLDLDLGALDGQRRLLRDAVAEQAIADRRVADAQAALSRATAADADRLAAAAREAVDARTALQKRRRDLQADIDRLAGGLVGQRDPSTLVESMDGQQPIALLPVRLETRYVPVGQPTALRIRVYPDDVQTIEHTPALTTDEDTAGRAWWTARFAHRDDEAERVLRDLTVVFGRGRAAWILRTLTPSNAVPAEGDEAVPDFPPTDTIDARSKATRAVLLPDRWCAIGFAAGRREVFRVWGSRIPDELLLSPDWLATDDPQKLLGGERAWMVDFDAALANGMALQVTQADVDAATRAQRVPFDLATGTLERLLIVGLDWTRTPEDGAAQLADLFGAQRDSTGFGFLPLGTPTNNTDAKPSGYSPGEERQPLPAATAIATDRDALDLLTWAAGIAPEALPPDQIPNAHLSEQRTAMHMLNAIWRGTFGDYLMELWNPWPALPKLKRTTATIYAARTYAMAYLRPGGALAPLRIGKQPYGVLPVVGRRFVDDGSSAIETDITRILGVLRPMWELAQAQVPRLVDGDVDRAKDALQTAPWSQTAFYRDRDAGKAMCKIPGPFSSATTLPRTLLVERLMAAAGFTDPADVSGAHIYGCEDFLPDPPYSAGQLAGVPWVLADAKDPRLEAGDAVSFGPSNNYLAQLAAAATRTSAFAAPTLYANQSGPALLQALAAYSVQKEQGDAVDGFALSSVAVERVVSLARPVMPHVEAAVQNEAMFTVTTPKELAAVVIPAVTGGATLGDHVANAIASQPLALGASHAATASAKLIDAIQGLVPQTRNLGGVKLSLDYLSGRTVGELNVAFRGTLDCFSYRLDAWILARANRRLERLRARKPTGVHVGGYGWVENLSADHRPDSEGHLIAPSLGQAATAALLRSGFMANHDQGAFDIELDSARTRRAMDLLQGLGRDQPLAALYGYRIERGLRDALLGRLIWPLRRAFPYRPAGAAPSDEPDEAIGARDVVDGVALFDAWESGEAKVFDPLNASLTQLGQAGLSADERAKTRAIVLDALDLADGVSDLLVAEGTHQVVQGNLDRAAAAMAIADKQALPIETQVQNTPRGGASYTQRIVVLCPDAPSTWPVDVRSRAEPALDAWLATQLGDPARYRFAARGQRLVDGAPVIDAEDTVVAMTDLGLSALSAVWLAATPAQGTQVGANESGFRERLVAALLARVDDPATLAGLDVRQDGAAPDDLGVMHFEALATTLKAVVDGARPATRKDLVRPDDAVESTLPDEGEYPGVDLADLQARAADAVATFEAGAQAVEASVDADGLLTALAGFGDFLPRASWPAQVAAIDAAGADPAGRETRGTAAREAVVAWIAGRRDALAAEPALAEGQAAPTHGQQVLQAMDRLRLLLGKDFPVLPRFALGSYATDFSASLAAQATLTADDPWRVDGWLVQMARVHDGSDRFVAARTARDALLGPGDTADLAVVQWPPRADAIWAALPEAWVQPEGVAADPTRVPEELQAWTAARPAPAYRDIRQVAPDLAIALHVPGGRDAIAADQSLAGLVCDEWAEFVPDPFQTAGIAFHYDAPGARPPQSILLAMAPDYAQDAWRFEDVLDTMHEALDLSKLRAVRPRDLGGGLGALLPGNYLPHAYTDDLPSVQVLKMRRDAMSRLVASAVIDKSVMTLGKV